MTDKNYNTRKSFIIILILPLKISFKTILPKRFFLTQKAQTHKIISSKHNKLLYCHNLKDFS